MHLHLLLSMNKYTGVEHTTIATQKTRSKADLGSAYFTEPAHLTASTRLASNCTEECTRDTETPFIDVCLASRSCQRHSQLRSSEASNLWVGAVTIDSQFYTQTYIHLNAEPSFTSPPQNHQTQQHHLGVDYHTLSSSRRVAHHRARDP